MAAKSEAAAVAKSVAAQQSKEQKYARMKALAVEIANLKKQPGQQTALAAAQNELKQLSRDLGGDLPANEGVPTSRPNVPAIAAAPPPGCVLSFANVSSSGAPVPIPDGPGGTISRTLTISGVDPYAWDVDLVTNITHTWNADLDITLTSPAGTVVVVSTDNGGDNDNVFAGTVWDDQAGTPVSDAVFANQTVATPLVTEGAMGDFRGENPNGIWTLTITDDTAADIGMLNSWSLALGTVPSAPPLNWFNGLNNTPTAIVDSATISSTVTIAGAGPSIVDIDLQTFITHTWNEDLDITLRSPEGTVVTITTDNGSDFNNVFNGTMWDDGLLKPVTDYAFTDGVAAPELVVEEAMSAFQGENPNGTWTLTITDDLEGDVGVLNSWQLFLETSTGCSECAITCPANLNVQIFGSSAVVTYPLPTVPPNCGPVICTPPSGSTFPIGMTTITCSNSQGSNSCSFKVMVTGVQGAVALSDVGCTAPGDAVTGTASFTNNTGASAASTATISLAANLVAVPGSCTASVGSCVIANASTINWSGTLANNQTVNISYLAQVNNTPPAATVCTTMNASIGDPVLGSLQNCIPVNCQPKGPGGPYPYGSEMGDQKAGSVLIYNIYTSSTDPSRQNTRINITNADPSRGAFVHLFFVAEGCSVADSYLCLTPNQTASFLASDLDPGTTGYLVAVAVDARGCPIAMNCLIGDEYVKFASGHEANLGALAFAGLAGGLPACDQNSVTATIAFDGVSYNRTPAVLALDNVGSRADGNDTMLILNRIGGNLGIGAASLGTLFGILYDDAENALSFSVTGGCQLRSSISNNFPRTTPRFETFIPAGRTGWLRIYNQTGAIGLTGAAINFNANSASSAGAFNQGHNLHALRLNNQMSYVIPVFPPSC